MKRLLQLAFLLAACYQMQAEAAFGKIHVHSSGTVVAAWQALDEMSNQVIMGAIGSTSTDPSTWTKTMLSSGISEGSNTAPMLFDSPNGDVIVMWQYPDENNNYFLAGAMLPVGTTTWNVATISTSDVDAAGFDDEVCGIDSSGNMLAAWTTYDGSTNTSKMLGATATMGASTTWSTPFEISDMASFRAKSGKK